MNILPVVNNTNDVFGETDKKIFGKTIPITCMVGDQQASLFGHRCFKKGDLKITLGSGGFVSMNVGFKPKFSTKGLFPLIAWTFNTIPQYKLEGQVATVGTFIDWAIEKMNLFESVEEMNRLASECESSNGIYVVPTLTGIRFPYFKPELKASFSGLSLNSDKAYLARAVVEGIVHRVVDLIEGMEQETKIPIPLLRIDGGVSKSNVIMQVLADFSGKTIYRSSESDLASLGAGYFAGLATGFWKSQEEILKISIPNTKFKPTFSNEKRLNERRLWKAHIKASEKFYKA